MRVDDELETAQEPVVGHGFFTTSPSSGGSWEHAVLWWLQGKDAKGKWWKESLGRSGETRSIRVDKVLTGQTV